MSNKLVEKYDDNPGAYFSMLVENWGDYSENDVNVVIKKVEDTYVDENGIVSKDNYNKVSKYLDKNYPEIKDVVIDNLIDMYGKPSDESLKEDKFIPQDKMSKKVQKELNDKKRGTWGSTNPVTRVQPNKKAYDRKRDKKAIEESKKLKEDVSVTEEDDYDRFYSDEWWYIGPELSEYGSVEYPYLTKTLKDVDSNDELYLKVEVPYSDSDNDFEDYEPFIDSNFGLKWFGKGSRQFKYAVKKICDYLNSEGIEVNITEERFKRI